MKLFRILFFVAGLAPLLAGIGDNATAQDRWQKRQAERDKMLQQERDRDQDRDRDREFRSKKAWLGVQIVTVDKTVAKEHDLSASKGVYVEDVVDDSPADDAGLRSGDIILKYNGNELLAADELIDLVSEGSPNDEVTLLINRDGRTLKEVVRLGEWSDRSDNRFRAFQFDRPGNVFEFKERLATSYIGVSLETVSGQLAESFGVDGESAALVTAVQEGAPADKAGLKAGDVIVAVDGEPIEDLRDVQDIVQDKDAGESVEVTILRDRSKKEVALTVDERDDDGMFGNLNRRFNFDFDFDDDGPFWRQAPHMRGFHRGNIDPDVQFFDFQDRGEHIRKLERKLERLERKLEEMQKQLDGR